MIPNGPPGIQPWIRETSKRLDALERRLAIADQKATVVPISNPVFASVTSNYESFTGVSGWSRMVSGQGPDVSVSTLSGLIRVTLSAYVSSNWTGIADATAYGAMVFSVNGALGADLQAEAHQGLLFGFIALLGKNPVEGVSASLTRVLRVPPGTYSLKTEYLYRNVTSNINIRWANRTIVAEPI